MNEVIKSALMSTGLTQNEIAEKLSVTQQAVSNWYTGVSRPSFDTCQLILKLFGIDLVQEINKAMINKNKVDNMENRILREIDSFDKAYAVSKNILEEAMIERKYSYPVFFLLQKLLPAVIGLSYHQMLKRKDDDLEFWVVYSNLTDIYDTSVDNSTYQLYDNYLERSFYLMGMDLFESFEPDKIPNHDYCKASMESWYDFQNMLVKNDANPFYCELMIAITEVANLIEC